MAISRTILVDDDGSGSTGTVLNNAERQVMYDQIDAVVAAPRVWTAVTLTSVSGSKVDWDPGIVGNTILYLSLAGALDIHSLKPATVFYGQQVRIHSVAAPGTFLNVIHESASGSSGYRISCRKSPTTVDGFWAYVDLQYGVFNSVNQWTVAGFGNGIGGALLLGDALPAAEEG